MMTDLYDNLLRATDNTSDIAFEKYGTITKIENSLCGVIEEDTNLEHTSVPILNKVDCQVGDKVVLGFIENSIYNPIILGNLSRKTSSGTVDIVTSWEQTLSNSKVPSEKLVKDTIDDLIGTAIQYIQQ